MLHHLPHANIVKMNRDIFLTMNNPPHTTLHVQHTAKRRKKVFCWWLRLHAFLPSRALFSSLPLWLLLRKVGSKMGKWDIAKVFFLHFSQYLHFNPLPVKMCMLLHSNLSALKESKKRGKHLFIIYFWNKCHWYKKEIFTFCFQKMILGIIKNEYS